MHPASFSNRINSGVKLWPIEIRLQPEGQH